MRSRSRSGARCWRSTAIPPPACEPSGTRKFTASRGRVQIECADVEQLFQSTAEPARSRAHRSRPAGFRPRAVARGSKTPSPDPPFLQKLMETVPGGAIKLSPAANFLGKFPDAEIELVSLNGRMQRSRRLVRRTRRSGSLAGDGAARERDARRRSLGSPVRVRPLEPVFVRSRSLRGAVGPRESARGTSVRLSGWTRRKNTSRRRRGANRLSCGALKSSPNCPTTTGRFGNTSAITRPGKWKSNAGTFRSRRRPSAENSRSKARAKPCWSSPASQAKPARSFAAACDRESGEPRAKSGEPDEINV